MDGRQNTKQKPRQYPSNQDEIKTLEAIAKSSLMLDSMALKTLKYKGNPENAKKFEKLTKGYVDCIENDHLRNLRFTLRVNRFVSDLKLNDLLDLISRPVRNTYYLDAIYLRVNVCYEAKDEDDGGYSIEETPSQEEECAKEELRAIVEEVQKLDRHVRDADDKSYAGEKILQLKAMLRKLDGALATACEYLGDEHKPLANWDTTDQQTASAKSPDTPLTASPPATAVRHARAKSIFAFLVPVLCVVAFIPACIASFNAEAIPGKATDSDFYQLVASTIIQLLGIGYSIWPIINDLRPKRDLLIKCWTYAGISICFTIVAVPLYLTVPVSWSGISTFLGSCMQSLLQLELMLGVSRYKSHTD